MNWTRFREIEARLLDWTGRSCGRRRGDSLRGERVGGCAACSAGSQRHRRASSLGNGSALGRIHRWFVAVQRVEVRPRVSGAIDKVHFSDGQIVKAGDPLFTIDPRPYQIAVDSARADVARMQSQTNMLSKDVARGELRGGGGAITRRDLDQRRGGSRSARAPSLMARTRRCATRNSILNGPRCARPSPAACPDSRIDVGNLVQAGVTLLTTIVTLDPIYFEFDVSESDFLHYARSGVGRQQTGILRHIFASPTRPTGSARARSISSTMR